MTKKRKRRLVYLGLAVGLIAAGGLAARLWIMRIDAEAELFATTGQAAIELLGEYQEGMGQRNLERVLACYDSAYANEHAGYWNETLRSDRDGVRVYDWQVDGDRPFTRDDMATQLAKYLADKRSIDESKVKLDAVEAIPTPGAAVVRAVLWLRGMTTAGQAFECHALMRLWLRTVDGAWRIHKQDLVHGETVTGDRTGFTDATACAGLTFLAHHNPLWQTEEWSPNKFGIIRYGSAGVTAVDYDNDGFYDIFLCDGWRPRLFRNNGDGTFTDVTTQVGLPDELCGCNVAIFADFNNDGYKDLFIGVGTGASKLYKSEGPDRNGQFHFTDVTEGSGIFGNWVTVAAAADYDHDGKLDLYLGRYLDPRKNLPTTLFYSRNGEGNTLLKNEGNFHFRDVTAEAGVRDGGLTLGLAWGDVDGDGFEDLFVANDFGRNTLFHNNGNGTFTDVSTTTGALDLGFSMSATMADLNNDGALDIYTSKVHSGQRWYGQAPSMHKYLLTSWREGTLAEDYPVYRELYGLVGAEWHAFGDRMVRGNSLLLNDGRGQFRDVGEQARSNPFGWYWGSAAFDYDNDGLQDLYAVNGWISGKTHEDL